MKHLIILFALICMTGCAGTLPEPGMPNESNTAIDEKHLPVPKTVAEERKGGMSPVVTTLLGIGAGAQLGAVLSMNIGDEAGKDPIVPLILFGTGLILWGTAGIVYLVEDEDDDKKESNEKESNKKN